MDTTSDISIAKAILELADAVKASNVRDDRITLTVFTPSTGGELSLKIDPKQPMTEFMAYLGEVMAKREEVLKAGIELNAKLGIGVKGAK